MIYLGLLHEDLRFGPHDRDRFQMMGAVLNLTDGQLNTTIEWMPPLAPAVANAIANGPIAPFSGPSETGRLNTLRRTTSKLSIRSKAMNAAKTQIRHIGGRV